MENYLSHWLVPFVFIFFLTIFPLAAEEVYISPFQLTEANGEIISSRLATQEELALSAIILKGLNAAAPKTLRFALLPSLSPASQKILNRDLILTKLEASVVCYYENLDYLLYGKIAVDQNTGTFKATVALYEKQTNAILKLMEFRDTARDAEAFVRNLIPQMAKDVLILFSGREQPESSPPPEEKQIPDQTTVTRTDGTDIKTRTEETPPERDEKTGTEEKTAPPPEKKERPISLYVEGGGFFIMQHEWFTAIDPLVTGDLGVKVELPIINTTNLDFSLRVGGALSYAFAHNKPAIPYISYHSIKVKSAIEAYLQFSEFFAVYLGGGPFYQLDVIDFQNVSKSFFTDRATTLGAQALLGVDFILNQEGTFGMGLVNSLDVSLFQTNAITYNLRIVFIFRI